MTSISIEALKGKTIKEIQELIKQAESLPENQSSTEPGIVNGTAKPQTVQELLEEIENESI